MDGNVLASILTIFHEIPLARELFLHREDILSDFGYDPEWWKGKAIGRTQDARRSSSGETLDDTVRGEKQLIHELQRLMAFLDKTERSYGSVEALEEMDVVKNAKSWDVEGRFFEAWKESVKNTAAVRSIFSRPLQPRQGASDEDIETAQKDMEFAILDLVLPDVGATEEVKTLYDVIDRTLWQFPGYDEENNAYMTHVGDIISFRLTGTLSTRSVTVPEHWFSDRYLEESRQAALEMRRQQSDILLGMAEISHKENVLQYTTLQSGKTVKVQNLFQVSMMHDAEPTMDDMVNGVDDDTLDAEMNSEPRVRDRYDVSAELQKVMGSIDRKLKGNPSTPYGYLNEV
jgi:hypothetical protein